MLIISNGTPKSATTLYFHLTDRIVRMAGGNKGVGDVEAMCAAGDIDGSEQFVQNFNAEVLSKLLLVAQRTGPLVIKVHTEGFPELLAAIDEGKCKMTYGYRDPRDMILSARDHHKRQKEFFPEFSRDDDAINNAAYWATQSLKWIKRPEVHCYSYRDMLLNPFAELRKLAAYLGLEAPDERLKSIIQYEKANRMPGLNQLNKARLMRYHTEMDRTFLKRCNSRLGDLIVSLGFDLDAEPFPDAKKSYSYSLSEMEESELINFNDVEKANDKEFRWSRSASSFRVSLKDEKQFGVIYTLGLRRSLTYNEVAVYLDEKRIPQSLVNVTQYAIYFEVPLEYISGLPKQLLTVSVLPVRSKNDSRELGIPMSQVSFYTGETKIPKDKIPFKYKIKKTLKRRPAPLPVLPVWKLPLFSGVDLGSSPNVEKPKIEKLIVSHSEVNNRHGTGVLIQQFFTDISEYGVLLTAEHYGGGSVGNRYPIVYRGKYKAPRHSLYSAIIDYFGHHPPKQVYIVPFSDKDFYLAIALKDIFECEVCIHIMDDNHLYGGVVTERVIHEALLKADIVFGISPQLIRAYNEKFSVKMNYFPPTIPGEWISMSRTHPLEASEKPVMIGNIWSADWMKSLMALLLDAGVSVDWFANNPDSGHLQKYVKSLESHGIFRYPALSEVELLSKDFGGRPYSIIPSAPLDGRKDPVEKLARLSLPSRAILLAAGGNLPILVVGSRESAIAQFVIKNDIGEVATYNKEEFLSCVRSITDLENNQRYRSNAERIAASFSSDGIQNWIWESTRLGDPADDRFERMMR